MFSTKSFTTIQFHFKHDMRNPYLAHMVQVAVAYNSHLPYIHVSHRRVENGQEELTSRPLTLR